MSRLGLVRAGPSGRERDVDNVHGQHVIEPQAPGDNAFVVKVPDDAYGAGVGYGEGQAFLLLRNPYAGASNYGADVVPDKYVLYRVDRHGGIGSAGGLHVVPGARDPGNTPGQAMWVQQIADTHGIIVQAASDAPAVGKYFLAETLSGGICFEVGPDGRVHQRSLAARAKAGSAQTATTGQTLIITLGVLTYDFGGHWAVATNDRLIVQRTGLYDVKARVTFAGNATGYRQALIQRNGATVVSEVKQAVSAPAGGPAITTVPIAENLLLNAGDYLQLGALQTSGGDLSVLSNTYSPALELTYINEGV